MTWDYVKSYEECMFLNQKLCNQFRPKQSGILTISLGVIVSRIIQITILFYQPVMHDWYRNEHQRIQKQTKLVTLNV